MLAVFQVTVPKQINGDFQKFGPFGKVPISGTVIYLDLSWVPLFRQLPDEPSITPLWKRQSNLLLCVMFGGKQGMEKQTANIIGWPRHYKGPLRTDTFKKALSRLWKLLQISDPGSWDLYG